MASSGGRVRVTFKGAMKGKIPSSVVVRMKSTSPHALTIHEGRTPGSAMPPIEPLKDWARRVLGDEGAAYPVAKAIAAEGFNEAYHGGKEKAEYLTLPIQERGREMARMYAEQVKKGAKPDTAARRVGEQFLTDANNILDRHWKHTGDLANHTFYEVELEGGLLG